MKQVSETVMDHDVPVRARHMRSIDDLLMFIEDNEVECAVVDQSLPTESRGLKLVLLAGVNQVKHLVVIAPPSSRAEIEAVDGVHQVLPSPATPQQIIDAVSERASRAAPVSLPVAAMVNTAAPVVAAETRLSVISAKVSACKNTLGDMAARLRGKSAQHYWTQLTGRFVTRPAVAAAASAFLCLGTISAVSLASGSFEVPGEANTQQALVTPPPAALDETPAQPDQITPSLDQALPVLTAAELSRRDARFRLLVSRNTIDLEIAKQHKLRQQFLAHITHLQSITAELEAAENSPLGADSADTSLVAGTRAAVLRAELALQEMEVGKIDTFLTHLNMLKAGVDLPDGSSLKLAGVNSAKAGD